MEYTQLKDDCIENTINRIKKILLKNNIKTEEFNFNNENTDNNKSISVCSTRLNIVEQKRPVGGVNGKGTSINNARASAYAELMERIQNFTVYSNPIEILKELNDKQIKFITQKNSIPYKEFCNKKNICLPFLDVKEKKEIFLPYDIIFFQQGTNGMAAGNTYEEAIVQGLSEICERYAIKEIFNKKIKLKTIQEKEYLKYKKINTIINFYKKNGFNITIKDATLNGKIPVICTIIEKDNIFSIEFGSHPSLPIAIERTLTEFSQGFTLANYKEIIERYPIYTEEKFKNTETSKIINSLFASKIFFKKNDLIEKCFLNKNIQNKENLKVWIRNEKNINNAKLVDFLLKNTILRTQKIYIRNCSFLDFPTIYIYIPNFSEIFILNTQNIKSKENYRNWIKYNKNQNNKKLYNINTLFKLCEDYYNSFEYNEKINSLFNLPLEYIALLCAIILKKTDKIKFFSHLMLEENKHKNFLDYEQETIINMLFEYSIYKENNKHLNHIKKILREKYSEDQINTTIEIIKNISFKNILNISINKKFKEKNIKELILKTTKLYKKNIPRQKTLYKIFEEFEKNN